MYEISELEKRTLSNCQYGCKRGKVYVQGAKSIQDCPNCAEIYKKIAYGTELDKNGLSILDILCIPKNYAKVDCEYSDVIDGRIKETCTPDSIRYCETELQNVYNKAILGECVEEDILFYLGTTTDILPFVYKVQKEGYAKGLDVTPLINSTELIAMQKDIETNNAEGYQEGRLIKSFVKRSYFEFCSADLVIVEIPLITTKDTFLATLNLIEQRHRRGKNTIVFSRSEFETREMGYILNSFIKKLVAIQAKEKQKPQNTTSSSSSITPSKPNKVVSSFSQAKQNYGVVQSDKGSIDKNILQASINEFLD